MAVDILEALLIAKLTYLQAEMTISRAIVLANTYKLKNQWLYEEDGQVDCSPEDSVIEGHAKVLAQCLMTWGASFNTAIDVLKLAKNYAFAHNMITGWKNLTGLKIKEGPPQWTPLKQ